MPGLPGMVKVLAIANVVVFLIQSAVDALTPGPFLLGAFSDLFGLSFAGLSQGLVWQPLTYLFLHGNIWHLLFNMLALVMFGSALERDLGSRRFLGLYLMTGLIGGLGWLTIQTASVGTVGVCVGASGAVYGILGAFAALHPRERIQLYIMLVLPVTMTARTLALLLGVTALVLTVINEGNVAHAAHLAGGIAGWLTARRIGKGDAGHEAGAMARHRTRMKKKLKMIVNREAAPPSPEEVDRILDKINQQGLGSLTQLERRMLERASGRKA